MQQIHKCIHFPVAMHFDLNKKCSCIKCKDRIIQLFLLDFKYVQSSLGGAVVYCEERNRLLRLVIWCLTSD